MKISELIFSNEYTSAGGDLNVEIQNITTDYNEISDNTLFVFIRSAVFDINNIKETVLKRRPIAIICDRELSLPSSAESVIIRVENTRKVLPYLFFRFYELTEKNLKICAVTGTNGKTSTATMLQKILTKEGYKVGFIGTGRIAINDRLINEQNYSMTTPDPKMLYSTIKNMTAENCDYIVMEVSSHALYFDKVLPLRFSVSIFTNLSEEHLDFHESLDAYFKTKMKLFSQSDLAVFNSDDEYSKRASEAFKLKKLTVGTKNKADLIATNIKSVGYKNTEYYANEINKRYKVKLNIGGSFNVYNSLMAIAAAKLLGVSCISAKAAISEISGIDGRMECIEGDVTVIIDYAHTPEAMKNVLFSLYSSKIPEQSIITVFGCGGNRDKSKRPKMARIAERYSDKVIVTTDNSRFEKSSDIIKDILSGFTDNSKRTVITSRSQAIEYAILNAKDGDIIAVIGKGHERYNIVNGTYENFDEREIIHNALEKRRSLKQNDNKA